MKQPTIFLFVFFALLLGGCPELQHPPQGSSGTSTAAQREGNIVILFQVQPVTQVLPQTSRVLISVYCATTLSGLQLQFEMAATDTPRAASLPTGYELQITYDAFDSANTFIGRGTAQTVLVKDQSPQISIPVAAVAAGSPYVNPLNGLIVGTALVPITVDAIDPGTGAALSNVLVALGNNAAASQYTDLSGQVVTAASLPVDLHLFYYGNAVSVLGFDGSQITIPVPGQTTHATVQGSFNPNPTLATNQSLEIYVSDGVQVATVNQTLAGGGLYSTNVPMMMGPIGVTAVLHDNDPLATDPFPNMATPVVINGPLDSTTVHSVTLSFPVTPTAKIQQSVDIVPPNQLPSAQNYLVDVWSLDAAGVPTPVANLDPGLTAVVTTPRWNGYVFTPPGAVNYRRYVSLNDATNGGTTEIWEEATDPALFAATVTPPDLPLLAPVDNTTTPLLSWTPPAGANPDLVAATITQSTRRWTFYLLHPAGVTQIQVPPVSAGAFAPIQSGGSTTDAVVSLLNWQAGMTWDPQSPDLQPQHWLPLSRATSAPVLFTPP